ncbi:uncharacterized protein JCM15063_002448 [Sporobolomyces koalae]|uniref:uncharacterized protein n=1 Tax=Sporobolomyces koalae TaxID=500713 RepID=UPI00317B2DDD
MEHAPFSPIASTSRAVLDLDSAIVPSSDVGEREEHDAIAASDSYWANRSIPRERVRAKRRAKAVAEPASSDDELALKATEMQSSREYTLPPPSAFFDSRTRNTRSPSPLSAHSLASPARFSPTTLQISSRTSSVPPVIDQTVKDRHSRSPMSSTASFDGDAQARTRPKSTAMSPTRSERQSSITPRARSRSISPFPVLPPSPVGRALRTRTAAQLKPFSTEQFRYTKSLLKNGWAGAVVAGPKPIELSVEEIKRKKLERRQRKKDDLGGWLVDQDADGSECERTAVLERRSSRPSSRSSSDQDESEDGLELLEREAARIERMQREVDSGLGIKPKSKSSSKSARHARDSNTARRQSHHTHDDRLFVKKRPRVQQSSEATRPVRQRAESEPPASSPGPASRRNSSNAAFSRRSDPSNDVQKRNVNKRKTTTARADSEPPASSPAHPRPFVAVPNRRMAKPSKTLHARRQSDNRSALDSDILNLPVLSSDSDDVQIQSVDESDHSEESEEESRASDTGGSEEEEDEEEDNAKSRRSRLRLDSKRQKALGAMLPAVFFKKAKADLKLMEQERDLGLSSGSEINSGDEEAEQTRKNQAKRRKVSRLLDEPMRLDADVFTDESGEEPEDTDSQGEQDEQEENDAVTAWMRNFAPGRRQADKEGEIDIVDRFLKRARRPTKADRSRSSKSGAGAGARGTRKAVVDKENVRRKRKEKARAKDRQGTKRTSRDQQLKKSAQQRIKTVPLDTDRSLFVFAGLRQENDDQEKPRSELDRLAPEQRRASSTIGVAAQEDNPEIWASFGKFSPDFGIRRLVPGVRLTSKASFVSNGYLRSLVQPDLASILSCDAYNLTLEPDAEPATIETQLPSLVDSIYDSVIALSSELHASEALGRVLQFLGNYISVRIAASSTETKHRFGSALATQLDHLTVRLDNADVDAASGQETDRLRILIDWYAIDLTARLGSISAVGGDSRRLARLVSRLVRRLLQHGADRTLASLKKYMFNASATELVIADSTVEAWLGILTLATRQVGCGDAVFDQSDFWTILLEEITASLQAHANSASPVIGEMQSLVAMLVCAVSQFTPAGVSTATPRLQAHWPVLIRALEPIKASALAAPDHRTSSTAIARRDRYIWSLFARCLLFVERWGWKVDVKDDLLTKLFDVVAARRLSNLSTEPVEDFPSILVNLDSFDAISLDQSADTAFSIFLKLVISAVQNLPDTTDSDKRKRSTQLTRLCVRLAPMTTAWNRASPELSKSDSILVNHYSLLLTLAILHPAQAAQKVEQASKLLTFAETEGEARKTTIRAIRYYALAFRHFDLSLAPLLGWLAKVNSQLQSEYIDIEKQRRGMKRDERVDNELWPRALLITMSLRLIQDVLRWTKPGDESRGYPDPTLLDPAWTSQLFSSPLALDPMIGREILKMINCFLDLRQMALSAIAPVVVVSESQDDYGMDEFDFEDPTLDALLGTEGEPPAPAKPQDDPQAALEQDKILAERIKTCIGPSFFSLVSRIYSNTSGSGPTVRDRSIYANDVVDSWSRCVAILVSHGLDTWPAYLRYGNHSFQRIADQVGRLDVGLFLAIRILEHDPSIYLTCTEEIVAIWFSTIVSSKLTTQHVLTSLLLNVETVSPLFDHIPFARCPATGRIEIEQLELLDKRIEFLRVVFSNAAAIATFQTSAAAPFAKPVLPKTVIMRYLRDLLSAMRTNLTALRDEPAKRSYARMVRDVLDAITTARHGTIQPFTETNLIEIATLRTAISNHLA